MSVRNYAIGTGFFSKNDRIWDPTLAKEKKPLADQLFEVWWKNTIEYSNPEKIYVCSADSQSPDLQEIANNNGLDTSLFEWANSRNWGHVSQRKLYRTHCGWSMGYLHGMMRCYVDGYDFIYKEQDCLAFGGWVDAMYDECKNSSKSMLIGSFDHKLKIEQSLTFIDWAFIPTFVSEWLSLKRSDKRFKPEHKFFSLINKLDDKIGYLPFGVGRNRPIQYDADVFYVQHIKADEFEAIGETEMADNMRAE